MINILVRLGPQHADRFKHIKPTKMTILNKTKFPIPLMHFYVIMASLFLQALTFADVYRSFAYLNLLFVLGFAFSYYKQTAQEHAVLIYGAVALWLVFIGAEWFATQHFPFNIKSVRHLLLAIGLMIGIAFLSSYHAIIKPKLMNVSTRLVYLYTISQVVALYLLQKEFGTTKNPHYLAIFSAFFLVIGCFLAIKHQQLIHRYLLGLSSIILGVVLINTSSRPTWIGLLLSVAITAVCLRRKHAMFLLLATSVLFVGLAITNVGNFKSRWEDLIMHANTEERVTIWQDAWKMQNNSDIFQWAFGHGLHGFEQEFPRYSRYHLNENIDFNSPHNALLEVLYQFGVVGALLVLAGLVSLYRFIISAYLRSRDDYPHAWIYLLLLMVVTIDIFSVGITMPFFVSMNLNVLAVATGICFYLKHIRSR